jgi:hypothetical protein
MRLVWQLVGTLLLVGLVLKFWWLIAIVIAVVLAWRFGPGWWRAYQVAVGGAAAVG